MCGRVEYWWNGGGLDKVHSSVVAPSPHGFGGAFFPAVREMSRFTKNTPTLTAVIMYPMVETLFQPAKAGV